MSYEDLRQDIITAFQDAHTASYSTVPVNYPNKPIVDIENQRSPFVKVELMMPRSNQMCLGSTYIRVGGELYVVFYDKVGAGIKASMQYLDFIVTNFSLTTVGDITFKEVIPLPEVSYPSWVALRIRIPFTIEFYT